MYIRSSVVYFYDHTYKYRSGNLLNFYDDRSAHALLIINTSHVIGDFKGGQQWPPAEK